MPVMVANSTGRNHSARIFMVETKSMETPRPTRTLPVMAAGLVAELEAHESGEVTTGAHDVSSSVPERNPPEGLAPISTVVR